MIRSMTGYGRAQEIIGGKEITVEVKSVNHRFFEFSCKAPRVYGFLEEKFKSHIKKYIARGKVDVMVSIITIDGASSEVEINHSLAKSYVDALRNLGNELGLDDDVTLTSISRFSDIFIVRKTEEDEEKIWQAIKTVADKAIEKFVDMRSIEGEKMKQDLLSNIEIIEKNVAIVEEKSPETVKAYREKLTAKIGEVLSDAQVDEQRIITEAAIFAEKIAVDEETVRLRSHIAQFKDIIGGGGEVGRKIDFLIQEFNREANTIGSKSQSADIAKVVVEIKSAIEKIREQIQNIE
ncbi:MAG: YicC/YloC family endoribonuclease [Oscillospiraceae bacterium]